MTTEQSLKLEQLERRLKPSEGELIWLARICAADETLVHLGQLTRVDAGDMIHTMTEYERHLAIDAAHRADAKMDEFDLTRAC
jgi:hypothetical protein